MKVYDRIAACEKELTTEELIALMSAGNRQVDLVFSEKRSDEDGYLSWDAENWTTVDGKRFIRCYSLEGRVLRDSTTHNIYDLDNDFFPEQAEKVEIN